MYDSFDPYRVWLGIPPEARPPTHYQLLGVSPNETEQAVIEAAVLRQSGYVRNFQVGKYAKDAARILNEIAAAKACLLDPVKRAEYEAGQRARRPAARDPTIGANVPAVIDPLAKTLPPIDIDLLVAAATPASVRGARRAAVPRLLGKTKSSRRPLVGWLAVAGAGFAGMCVLAVIAILPRSVEKTSAGTIGEPTTLSGTYSNAGSVAQPLPPAPSAVETPIPPPLAIAPFSAEGARKHQEHWAKHLGREVEETNSIGMKMVLIPPGWFRMGSSDAQIKQFLKACDNGHERYRAFAPNEQPQHPVTISRAYWIGCYEVTVDQFRQFAEETMFITDAEKDGNGGEGIVNGHVTRQPSFSWRELGEFRPSNEMPAVNVSWNDATAFCHWLTIKEAKTYRLPTDAEWEFACRAGTETMWFFGEEPFETVPTSLRKYAWTEHESKGRRPHSTGQKLPNPFGLHDVYGNVEEWCNDWFERYSESATEDPVGPTSGEAHVVRGCQFYEGAHLQRSAMRSLSNAESAVLSTGFRVVCEVDP